MIVNYINSLIFCALILISATTSAQTDSIFVKDTLDNIIPVFTTTVDLLENEQQSQDISGLLQSSRDVYVNQAGFNFSAARYRLRGYSSENTRLFFNGIPVNDPENGWTIWSYWGGLNDVTRYPENSFGISNSAANFGSIGAYSYISALPSVKNTGTRVSYAATNRSYRNRAMYTYNSGLNNKGWGFLISGSSRWSDEGYVPGTYYSAGSYLLSIEKKINNKHTVNLMGFGAPTVQGRQGIAVQETYELTGENFYNPYWGYQTQNDGTQKKRNARSRNNHKPYVTLGHYWNISEKLNIQSNFYAITGRTANTNLNWFNANDPRPDYYKYLPSYFINNQGTLDGSQIIENQQEYNKVLEGWQTNDPNTTQLNWDLLYNANYNNLYTQNNIGGEEGNSYTAKRSKYIVEEYRLDPRHYGFNSFGKLTVNENSDLNFGLSISNYKSKNFRLMNDLLGGDYWVDIDQFALRDFDDPNQAQNDLQNPNKIIKVGDIFGYNYDIHVNKNEIFSTYSFNKNRVESFFGINFSTTTFWREGKMQNGRFPDNSLGKSEKQTFLNYGAKFGFLYKITGRHLLSINGMYKTEAPYVRNAYVSPRTRDQLVPNLSSTEIISGDINYNVRLPFLKARLTGFFTQINNQTWARSFYHDEYRTFVNYMMTNVDQTFMGIEFGFESNITSTLQFTGAFTVGDYLYKSRPVATITRDNSQEVIALDKVIYLKNFKIGGMPQQASSLGLKYNSPKYWYAGINFNYFTDIYLSPNPDRRTAEALAGYGEEYPYVNEIIDQTKLKNGNAMNLFIGKSWKFYKNNSYLRLGLNVNNLLDNTKFKTGGFEQLRYDASNIQRFPNKYGYMYGRTYFLMLSYLY
ncbi:MAG: Plug domain-containing protein [Flavobacteriales bacterium]|nr:Plug domain-containing protein [Flavobacteriales bacterium]